MVALWSPEFACVFQKGTTSRESFDATKYRHFLKKGATLSIACKCLGSKWGAADKDENLKALAGVLSLPPCTLGPQNKSFVPNISENGCKTINWGKSREPKCLKPHAVNRIYLWAIWKFTTKLLFLSSKWSEDSLLAVCLSRDFFLGENCPTCHCRKIHFVNMIRSFQTTSSSNDRPDGRLRPQDIIRSILETSISLPANSHQNPINIQLNLKQSFYCQVHSNYILVCGRHSVRNQSSKSSPTKPDRKFNDYCQQPQTLYENDLKIWKYQNIWNMETSSPSGSTSSSSQVFLSRFKSFQVLQVLSSPLKSCQVVSSPFKSFQVVSSCFKLVQVLSTPFKSFQVLSNRFKSVKYFQVVSSRFKSSQVVSSHFKSFQVVSDVSICFKLFQVGSRRFKSF